jgi:hypothetical protein
VAQTAQLIDKAAIEKEAADLKARVEGWAYLVPSYQQERFQRRNTFFLKEVTDEEIIGGPTPPEPGSEEAAPEEGTAPSEDAAPQVLDIELPEPTEPATE